MFRSEGPGSGRGWAGGGGAVYSLDGPSLLPVRGPCLARHPVSRSAHLLLVLLAAFLGPRHTLDGPPWSSSPGGRWPMWQAASSDVWPPVVAPGGLLASAGASPRLGSGILEGTGWGRLASEKIKAASDSLPRPRLIAVRPGLAGQWLAASQPFPSGGMGRNAAARDGLPPGPPSAPRCPT